MLKGGATAKATMRNAKVNVQQLKDANFKRAKTKVAYCVCNGG
jgi:hypothetical protein